MSVFHTCPACRRTFTRADWLALEFVGVAVEDFEDDGSTEVQESRNCPCGSTTIRIVGAVFRKGDGPSLPPPEHVALYVEHLVETSAELLDALRATSARCMELREENRRLLAFEVEVGRVLADVASPIDFPDRIPPGSDPADISADSYQEHIDRARRGLVAALGVKDDRYGSKTPRVFGEPHCFRSVDAYSGDEIATAPLAHRAYLLGCKRECGEKLVDGRCPRESQPDHARWERRSP